jgi:hypothetical protein
LSHEDGYKKASSFSTLDMVMYEVVKELRETISSLEVKIAAQDKIIIELKSGCGGGNRNEVSFADIV